MTGNIFTKLRMCSVNLHKWFLARFCDQSASYFLVTKIRIFFSTRKLSWMHLIFPLRFNPWNRRDRSINLLIAIIRRYSLHFKFLTNINSKEAIHLWTIILKKTKSFCHFMLLNYQIYRFFCFFYKDFIDKHKIPWYFHTHLHTISIHLSISLDVITQWKLIGTSNFLNFILVNTNQMNLAVLLFRMSRKSKSKMVSSEWDMQMLIDEWCEFLRAADESLVYLGEDLL